MAGAQWGNLCAENKHNQQKMCPGWARNSNKNSLNLFGRILIVFDYNRNNNVK